MKGTKAKLAEDENANRGMEPAETAGADKKGAAAKGGDAQHGGGPNPGEEKPGNQENPSGAADTPVEDGKADFDAQGSYTEIMGKMEEHSKGMEAMSGRITHIEDVLDGFGEQKENQDVLDEETGASKKEGSYAKDEHNKDEEGDENGTPDKDKEDEARMGKDELGKLKAQFAAQKKEIDGLKTLIAKFANSGKPRSAPSSAPADDTEASRKEAAEMIESLGIKF